jgi:hypothetical protein
MRFSEIRYAPEGEVGSAAPAPAAPAPTPVSDTVSSQTSKPISSADLTPSAAGRMLRALRKPRATDTEVAAEAAPPEGDLSAPDREITSQEDGTAPDQTDQATGEAEADAPQSDEDAPREPPRSWSAEDREIWSELTPRAQERILQRASEDERAARKAQNEAAQLRNHFDQIVGQEKGQLEAVRQQYEAALPSLYDMLSQNDKFADIQSFEDVKRLSQTDWARYIEYDAHVKELGIVQAQLLQAQQRQVQEYGQNWMRWSTQEDQKFAAKVPEMKEPAKAKSVHENGARVLTEVGFTPHEINALWNGQASLSMRDHRVQQLFYDAIMRRTGKGQVEAAKSRELPAVQRPGVAFSGNRGVQALQSAKQKLSSTGDVKDGVALLRAQRAAKAGRAR